MQNIQKFFKKSFPYIVIVCIGLFLINPVFIEGFYPMHDDTQVVRVHQMAQALRDGQFPVRWVSDLGYGYGYPIFNFYAPLAYYIGALFVLLGYDVLLSTKIMIALPLFIAGIGMYLLAKEFWGKSGGIISAALAMCATYVAVNIFVRGAISEYYAYSFIPFVFYSIYTFYKTQTYRYVILLSLSFFAVIVSHNLTTLMLIPFFLISLAVLIGIFIRQKKNTCILFLSFAVFTAILLSAFYWLPALLEMKYTNVSSQIGGKADFRDHFVCFPQLWESQWGYGGSTPGCIDGLSFRIGKLHILLSVLAIPLLFVLKNKKQKLALGTGFFFVFVSVFFLLPHSTFIWNVTQVFAYIQYPWRFLSIASLSISFIAGSVILYSSYLPLKLRQVVVLRVVLVLSMLLFSYLLYSDLFKPQTIQNVRSEDLTSFEHIRYKVSKISDEYMPKGFTKPMYEEDIPRQRIEIVNGDGIIRTLFEQTQNSEYEIQHSQEITVRANIAFFPAISLYLNNKKIPFIPTSEGLLFTIQPTPDNTSIVKIVFEQTIVEKLGNALSIIGIVGLLAGIIYARKTKQL